MRYIKGTIDVGLVFEKDNTGKQECIGYVDLDYAGDLDKTLVDDGICLHILTGTGELALHTSVYRRVVDYRG